MGGSLFGTGLIVLIIGGLIMRVWGEDAVIHHITGRLNKADYIGGTMIGVGFVMMVIGALVWLWS